MLSAEIKQDLQERWDARIFSIIPFVNENSDGELEQFYQVDMANTKESFYIYVDEYGACLGDIKHYEE